jgi:hypothetical protein
MASKVTAFRLRVRSLTGDYRTLTSYESPENSVPIVVDEYGALVGETSENGQHLISGVIYSEVSREQW